MFKCAITGQFSQPNEKVHRVVIATRDRTYYRWVRNEETNQWEQMVAGQGHEIRAEVNASAAGEVQWKSWSDDDRQMFFSRYYPELLKPEVCVAVTS